MWESIEGLKIEKIVLNNRLLLKNKDSLISYDLQGRKVLEQYNHAVIAIFGYYFVTKNAVYHADSLLEPTELFSVSNIDHVTRYGDYWIIADLRQLSLYSLTGELLDEIKTRKATRIVDGAIPIFISREAWTIKVKNSKLDFESIKLNYLPLYGSGNYTVTKSKHTTFVYNNLELSLQLPSFETCCFYEKYLFAVYKDEIIIYDCYFGVKCKTISIEMTIKDIAYNGQFIVASTGKSIEFMPFQISSTASDLFMREDILTTQVDFSLGVPFEFEQTETLTLKNCPQHSISQFLSKASNEEILTLFQELRQGPSSRLLLIIKEMNKIGHPLLTKHKKELLHFLQQEATKAEQAGILRKRLVALKNLPKIIPPYSVETVYF